MSKEILVELRVKCERCEYEWEAEDGGGTLTCPNCSLTSEPVIFLEEETNVG